MAISDHLAPDFKRSQLQSLALVGAGPLQTPPDENSFAILLFNADAVETKVRLLHLLGQKMRLVKLMLDKQAE